MTTAQKHLNNVKEILAQNPVHVIDALHGIVEVLDQFVDAGEKITEGAPLQLSQLRGKTAMVFIADESGDRKVYPFTISHRSFTNPENLLILIPGNAYNSPDTIKEIQISI